MQCSKERLSYDITGFEIGTQVGGCCVSALRAKAIACKGRPTQDRSHDVGRGRQRGRARRALGASVSTPVPRLPWAQRISSSLCRFLFSKSDLRTVR
jgi:hypothetical protein